MAKMGRKMRRGLLLAGFYGTLLLLIGVVLSSYIQTGNRSQLSAYDDDWNDISAFRKDINDMGVTTRSVVSSPLILNDIDDPGNATFVISGVERDTFSMPHFGESGFIEIEEVSNSADTDCVAPIIKLFNETA